MEEHGKATSLEYESPALTVVGSIEDLTETDDFDSALCSATTCDDAAPSDRALKQDLEPVDAGSILQRLVSLPVSVWTYRAGVADGGRHIGPMAQDWHAAFGVGGDTTIHHVDMNGVAIAAIQALYDKLELREREIGELTDRLETLEARLAALDG